MLQLAWELLVGWLERLWRRSLSRKPQHDPVYKQNVENLIKRSRSFEKNQ